jgi:hypothetical protein
MTTQTRKPRTRKPVARTIKLTAPGRVVITVGKEAAECDLAEFPVGGAFDGRAFRCSKVGRRSGPRRPGVRLPEPKPLPSGR